MQDRKYSRLNFRLYGSSWKSVTNLWIIGRQVTGGNLGPALLRMEFEFPYKYENRRLENGEQDLPSMAWTRKGSSCRWERFQIVVFFPKRFTISVPSRPIQEHPAPQSACPSSPLSTNPVRGRRRRWKRGSESVGGRKTFPLSAFGPLLCSFHLVRSPPVRLIIQTLLHPPPFSLRTLGCVCYCREWRPLVSSPATAMVFAWSARRRPPLRSRWPARPAPPLGTSAASPRPAGPRPWPMVWAGSAPTALASTPLPCPPPSAAPLTS